jgi:alpha-tubulin suppressor-like RCC1 family protein
VWTWGNDYYGQLGQGSRYNDAAVPVSVTDAWGPGVPITTISAGQSFSVALDASGAVWAWGQSEYGQLGIGVSGTSETVRATPVRVSDVEWVAAGVSIVDVEAGIDHVLALDDAGNVWAWGRNAKVELIPNTNTKTVVDSAVPAAFDALNHVSVTDVAAGSEHSVARDADGHVWAWGNSGSSNFYGEIGDGKSGVGLGNYAEPVNPVLSVSVSDVAAGREFTLARAQDGALWTWGHNNDGQLGHGVLGGTEATPAQVDVP